MLQTARNIAVSGDVTGTASFNGSANISITSTIANDAVTSAKIANGTIVNADIANNAINSAKIQDGTVTTNDILNNTITETDISDAFVARNSQLLDGIDSTAFVRDTGNETIAGTKTFSSPVVGATPTAANHLTTKSYVDTLVTQGVTWKGPVESGSTIVGTWGACDAGKQSWTTYNKNDDIIYICDGTNWLSIGSSASVPYATTSSAGKIQLAGDIGGTWNNVTINNNAITSAKIANGTIVAADIANNTITATQIAANAVGNSELASNAVQSVNIANGTITAADLANNSVASAEIVNGTIVNADISNTAAIAGTKISPNFGTQTVTAGL